MRIVVTGAAGMLGQDVVSRLQAEHDVRATTRAELDITDPASIESGLADRPEVIVNCAAWTAVDDAETEEASAFTVNAVAPHLLARASARLGSRLVHVSTDYVFDGHADEPYAEEAPLAPRSAYGRTKAAGEWAVRASGVDHLIVRTAWLYGANGPCFPKTMARLAAERDTLAVVSDQHGQPTWAADLADLITRMIEAGLPSGSYHGTSSGLTSWHGFAQHVVATLGKDPAMVKAITSEAFTSRVPRPTYSALGHDALERIGVAPIGHWRERWDAAAASVLGLA